MTTFADNLDGTAGALLSARSGWTRTGSTDNCILADTGTGFCQRQGTGGIGTWHSPTSQPTGNDQYAEAYLSEWGNNAYQLGVRCDTSAAGGNAYLVRRDGVTRTRLYKRVTGAFTLLGTYNTGAGSVYTTNKVRLEVTGTSLSVYVGATLAIGPVTDTAISSGSVSTLSRGGEAVTTTANLDDWGSGDLVAAGAIAGSTAPAFTASGALQAAGALAGASSPTVTGAGVISATGALSGTSSVAVTASGAIAGTGSLTGASSPAFTGSGAIAGAGSLAGSSDPAFTGSGTIYNASAPAGAISGAATVAASGTGTIAGAGAVVGAAPVTSSASGVLTGSGAMAGAATVAFTGSATVTASGLLSGASTLAITAAGAITGTSSGLSGTASVAFTGQGILRGSGALMGTSSATFTASAVPEANDNGSRVPTVSRPVLTQGASRPRQYSSPRPRAASSW